MAEGEYSLEVGGGEEVLVFREVSEEKCVDSEDGLGGLARDKWAELLGPK